MAKLKKTTPSKSEEPVQKAPAQPPQYQPRTPVTQEQKRLLYREAEGYWNEISEQYGYDLERPENLTFKMQAILGAPDSEMAQHWLKKSRECAQIMVLGAWARGKIQGPTNATTVERRLKRAESLAKMLEAKGLKDQAASQWERAETLRGQLEDIRNGVY